MAEDTVLPYRNAGYFKAVAHEKNGKEITESEKVYVERLISQNYERNKIYLKSHNFDEKSLEAVFKEIDYMANIGEYNTTIILQESDYRPIADFLSMKYGFGTYARTCRCPTSYPTYFVQINWKHI